MGSAVVLRRRGERVGFARRAPWSRTAAALKKGRVGLRVEEHASARAWQGVVLWGAFNALHCEREPASPALVCCECLYLKTLCLCETAPWLSVNEEVGFGGWGIIAGALKGTCLSSFLFGF